MPALQNDANLKSSIVQQEKEYQNLVEVEQNLVDVEGQELQQQHRELTQTDRLNKVLLKAFLDRINKGEIDLTFQQQEQQSMSSSSFDTE